VTSVSGRGVGMDVVKTNIERIGGTVDVASVPGAGTTLKIKIPLTLAIIPGLVIASGGERFVIPQVSLLELIRIEADNLEGQIERIHGAPVYRRRGSLLPIVYLNETLRLPTTEANQDAVNIVVVQVEDCQFGIVVDAISDTQEIVVKPVSKQLKGLNCYAGATIMGDGRVALILDVTGIGRRAGVVVESAQRKNTSAENKEQTVSDLRTYLMFKAGDYERVAVPLSLVARLEEIPAGEVERAGSRIVVQYRGRILSLFSLAQLLNPGHPPPDADPFQVVVFDNGKRAFGLIVDQILDITEDSISAWEPSAIPGLLGSAVIGKRVTDILDLAAIIDSIDHRGASLSSGDVTQRSRRARFEGPNPPRILLAGGTEFDRSLIRTRLELWGCQVAEATSDQEAFRQLAAASPDLILSGLEDSFAGRVHDVPGCNQIPIEPLDLGNSSLERLLHVLRAEPSSQEVLA
jgi:two-component system chemotaxis sensor kinase CheA